MTQRWLERFSDMTSDGKHDDALLPRSRLRRNHAGVGWAMNLLQRKITSSFCVPGSSPGMSES